MGFGTIFFIVVAAIVLYQLRSVLGRRTGSERPPFDPYSRPTEGPAPAQGNVVTLPSRRINADETGASPLRRSTRRPCRHPGQRGPAPDQDGRSELRGRDLPRRRQDRLRDDRDGLRGRRPQAPAESPLARGLPGFDASIAERERRGERLQSSFVGINEATITGAELKDREALVTVRIVSQLISATLKADGTVADGDPETVVEVIDVWTLPATRARAIRTGAWWRPSPRTERTPEGRPMSAPPRCGPERRTSFRSARLPRHARLGPRRSPAGPFRVPARRGRPSPIRRASCRLGLRAADFRRPPAPRWRLRLSPRRARPASSSSGSSGRPRSSARARRRAAS